MALVILSIAYVIALITVPASVDTKLIFVGLTLISASLLTLAGAIGKLIKDKTNGC